VVLVHVDTDLGDNPDDACALALLLAWPGVEIRSVTTVNDPVGARVPLVREVLALGGAGDVPVTGESSAVPELAAAAQEGAALLALGPLTNLARADALDPGVLDGIDITICGGWLDGPGPGLPAWDARRDSNVQADPAAARRVWEHAQATWVPVAASCVATLRQAQLDRLEATGRLGSKLAADCVTHGRRRRYADLGRRCSRLPDDLVTFHFDPVAAAVALGWSGARVERLGVSWVSDAGAARMVRSTATVTRPGVVPPFRTTNVVTHVDGEAFGELWLATLEATAG
jgi:inosine-uridine nucleoside N-ribohydrolase